MADRTTNQPDPGPSAATMQANYELLFGSLADPPSAPPTTTFPLGTTIKRTHDQVSPGTDDPLPTPDQTSPSQQPPLKKPHRSRRIDENLPHPPPSAETLVAEKHTTEIQQIRDEHSNHHTMTVAHLKAIDSQILLLLQKQYDEQLAVLKQHYRESIAEKRQEYESEMETLTGEARKLSKKNAKLDGEVRELAGRNEELEGEVGSLAGEVRELEGRIEELEGELVGYKTQRKSLMKSNKALQAEVGELEDRRGRNEWLEGEMERVKKSCEEQVDDLEMSVEWLEEQVTGYKNAEAEVDLLKEKNQKLREKNEEWGKKLLELIGRIEALEGKNGALEAEVKDTMEDLLEERGHHRALARDYDALGDVLTMRTKELQQFKQRCEGREIETFEFLTTRNRLLDGEVHILKAKCDGMQARQTRDKEAYRTLDDESKGKMATLEQVIRELRAEVAEGKGHATEIEEARCVPIQDVERAGGWIYSRDMEKDMEFWLGDRREGEYDFLLDGYAAVEKERGNVMKIDSILGVPASGGLTGVEAGDSPMVDEVSKSQAESEVTMDGPKGETLVALEQGKEAQDQSDVQVPKNGCIVI